MWLFSWRHQPMRKEPCVRKSIFCNLLLKPFSLSLYKDFLCEIPSNLKQCYKTPHPYLFFYFFLYFFPQKPHSYGICTVVFGSMTSTFYTSCHQETCSGQNKFAHHKQVSAKTSHQQEMAWSIPSDNCGHKEYFQFHWNSWEFPSLLFSLCWNKPKPLSPDELSQGNLKAHLWCPISLWNKKQAEISVLLLIYTVISRL